ILGSPADKETIESLEKEILVFEEFLGIHDLIVHNYGPGRQFASVHVEVPQNTDIVRCHEKIDLCERIVKENLDIELVIHMDPIDTDDETVSQVRLSIAERITDIDERLTIHDFRMTPFGESRTNLIFDVVVPSSVNIPQGEIVEKIKLIAKQINSSYECVITVDNDFTGK
ncbi:MAG: cation-efflux pump, partial [Clostridia bacterium]|nr:cation-efflux pump [Clostridia bacterium]